MKITDLALNLKRLFSIGPGAHAVVVKVCFWEACAFLSSLAFFSASNYFMFEYLFISKGHFSIDLTDKMFQLITTSIWLLQYNTTQHGMTWHNTTQHSTATQANHCRKPPCPLHPLSSHLLGEDDEKRGCIGVERWFSSASLLLVNSTVSGAWVASSTFYQE